MATTYQRICELRCHLSDLGDEDWLYVWRAPKRSAPEDELKFVLRAFEQRVAALQRGEDCLRIPPGAVSDDATVSGSPRCSGAKTACGSHPGP